MISVVIQGQVTKWSVEYTSRFKKNPLISEVIFSTWVDQDTAELADLGNITVLKSQYPHNPGMGNRNLQIISSKHGIGFAHEEYCLKVRSDFYLPQFDEMWKFFEEKHEGEQIFALSIYPMVFHPRDHIFLGKTQDLYNLFNIPLDNIYKEYNEFVDVRTETYIGAYYYARFNEKIYEFINNPDEYLTDKSPKRYEAFDIYQDLVKQKKGFIPFDSVPVEFPKYYTFDYPTTMLKGLYGETYYSDLVKNDFNLNRAKCLQ